MQDWDVVLYGGISDIKERRRDYLARRLGLHLKFENLKINFSDRKMMLMDRPTPG